MHQFYRVSWIHTMFYGSAAVTQLLQDELCWLLTDCLRQTIGHLSYSFLTTELVLTGFFVFSTNTPVSHVLWRF